MSVQRFADSRAEQQVRARQYDSAGSGRHAAFRQCGFRDTLGEFGSPKSQTGMAFHLYRVGRSMGARAFSNADADMLVLPRSGALRLVAEAGLLEVAPGELALIPRGMKLRVELVDGPARGFMAENFRPISACWNCVSTTFAAGCGRSFWN